MIDKFIETIYRLMLMHEAKVEYSIRIDNTVYLCIRFPIQMTEVLSFITLNPDSKLNEIRSEILPIAIELERKNG